VIEFERTAMFLKKGQRLDFLPKHHRNSFDL